MHRLAHRMCVQGRTHRSLFCRRPPFTDQLVRYASIPVTDVENSRTRRLLAACSTAALERCDQSHEHSRNRARGSSRSPGERVCAVRRILAHGSQPGLPARDGKLGYARNIPPAPTQADEEHRRDSFCTRAAHPRAESPLDRAALSTRLDRAYAGPFEQSAPGRATRARGTGADDTHQCRSLRVPDNTDINATRRGARDADDTELGAAAVCTSDQQRRTLPKGRRVASGPVHVSCRSLTPVQLLGGLRM